MIDKLIRNFLLPIIYFKVAKKLKPLKPVKTTLFLSMDISSCSICLIHNNEEAERKWEIYRDKTWLLRHHPEPAPLEGWLMLDTTRHCKGPIDFNEMEAASWGKMVKRASVLIKELTKCQRVYAIAFGEGAKHLHLHLIPRFQNNSSTEAWAIADHYREVIAGNHKAANPNKVAMLVKEARNLWI